MSTQAAPMTVRKTISVSCSVDRAAEAYESHDSGWDVVLVTYASTASEA